MIIVDKNVPKKFLKTIYSKLKCEKRLTCLFDSSEKNKNLNYINYILKKLFRNNLYSNEYN